MRKGVVSTHETLLTYGEDCCTRAGYAVRRPESGREPDAVAEPVKVPDPPEARKPVEVPEPDAAAEASETASSGLAEPASTPTNPPTSDGASFFGGEPIAIEPLEIDEVTPTTVLSKHADNRERGRKTLFVVPPADRSRLVATTHEPSSATSLVDETLAATVAELLSEPVGVETDGSEREFYNGPDRIALASGGGSDGGYALCAVARPDTRLRWREELGGGPSRDENETRTVLRADGDVVAAVGEPDDLRCPPASVFPYSYRRGADKRMHVRDPEGVVVGSFDGVTDMREAGFEPIPMPLVPEHLFDASLSGTWAVAVAAATTDRLYTSNGVQSLESTFEEE
ncbi:hypothetical protein [Haloprofundus salinisoli]|uniref:hypothetical protein n=1 Tax=Haloprofundus salinisoli TaxID=2876193 RepID=UPI001CC9C7B2|nr:hypothetical protein [Haloprofundus salinisoli]